MMEQIIIILWYIVGIEALLVIAFLIILFLLRNLK